MDKKEKEQQKILRNTLLFIGVVFAGFVLFFAVTSYLNHFEYNGVKFEISKNEVKGQTLYKTSIPVMYDGEERDYLFYLREDPRELEIKVPLNDDIVFRKNLLLDVTTENLFCEGDWNYFQLQLKNIEIFDIKLFAKNKSLNYTPERDYMFLTINEANKTEVNNVGGNAYDANVSNCEIASVADRVLLEAIIKNNQFYNN